jgi:beta-glucosidase
MAKISFPKDFLWGAATAAHQVEGNNVNSDWWRWEQAGGGRERSGQACRHYELFEQDFDIAKKLNHNCHRFSLEWSRIQPEEGRFCDEALAHYAAVIRALKSRGIEPLVTLHHFTSPAWFMDKGGWESSKSQGYFIAYVRKVVEALGAGVTWWVTINEPLVYVYYSYARGLWPPGKKSLFAASRVRENMAAGHIKAYRLIHAEYAKKGFAPPKVSIAHNMISFVPCKGTPLNRFAAWFRDSLYNREILHKLSAARSLDYIGINYYTRNLIDARGCTMDEIMAHVCREDHDVLPKNSVGWEVYPQGIYEMLVKLKSFRLPVVILENGFCGPDDRQRWEFIRDHLAQVHRALADGVRVKGYVYWSLLDNFEWEKGFTPRFGLVEVDYATFQRRIRESAMKYAEICRTGELEA